jgi:lipid-A-disaccharide synthase
MSHKIFIITGEPSGDLHGANLVKALIASEPDLEIQCWGGDKMQAAGAKVMKHVDDLAFMGFVEVVANLSTILKNFKTCRQQIDAFRPDLVVLIDYPGFNLRMAKHINAMSIPVAYYISPQIWAWKESRVEKIKRYVDHVFVILPFEKEFYGKHGVNAEYVGHPLLDEIKQIHLEDIRFRQDLGIKNDKPIIALLPGSRTQEIKLLLEPISKIVTDFPNYQFVVSKVAWQPKHLYDSLPESVCLLEGRTYELLKASEAAIVTSGTATLETALIGTPQVVVYKANALSVAIARFLVKIKYISLVNLILDEEVVKELIQTQVTSKNLKQELNAIVEGGARRSYVLEKYAELNKNLGSKGASSFVANRLLKIIQQ